MVDADALAPGIVVLLLAVSMADFLGGPGLGAVTALPIGVNLFGTNRHLVQLYELVIGFVALWVWWRVSAESCFAGRPFLITVSVLAFGRMLTDAFRVNVPLSSGFTLFN